MQRVETEANASKMGSMSAHYLDDWPNITTDLGMNRMIGSPFGQERAYPFHAQRLIRYYMGLASTWC
jgi:hypothetical protein